MTPSGPRPVTEKQKETQKLIDKFATDLRALNDAKPIPARWENRLLKAIQAKPVKRGKVDYERFAQVVELLVRAGDKVRRPRTKSHNPAVIKDEIAKACGVSRKTVERIEARIEAYFSEEWRNDPDSKRRNQAIEAGHAAAIWVQIQEEEELERSAKVEAMRRRFPQRSASRRENSLPAGQITNDFFFICPGDCPTKSANIRCESWKIPRIRSNTMLEQSRRFLRLPEVKRVTGYGRTAIYDKIKSGEFPAPYPLSDNGRAVAWDSVSIERWIESRIEAAGAKR